MEAPQNWPSGRGRGDGPQGHADSPPGGEFFLTAGSVWPICLTDEAGLITRQRNYEDISLEAILVPA
jgi:hypothetical protein